MGQGPKCYAKVDSTLFEVKRQTKTACVSKISMPAGCIRAKRGCRKTKHERSKITSRKPELKFNENLRIGRVVSGDEVSASYLGVREESLPEKFGSIHFRSSNCKSITNKQSPRTLVQTCKKFGNFEVQDAATQTIENPPFVFSTPLKLEHFQPRSHQSDGLRPNSVGHCKGRRNEHTDHVDLSNTANELIDMCCFPLLNAGNNSMIENLYMSNSGDMKGNLNVGGYDETECSLIKENDSLIGYIYKAQTKVNEIRTQLGNLCQFLTVRKNRKTVLKRDVRGEQLEKMLDDMIAELNNTPMGEESKIKTKNSSREREVGVTIDSCGYLSDNTAKAGDMASSVSSEGVKISRQTEKLQFTPVKSNNMSFVENEVKGRHLPQVMSLARSDGQETLALLKAELSVFFNKMKGETDKLILAAESHHETLLNYSESNSSHFSKTSSIVESSSSYWSGT